MFCNYISCLRCYLKVRAIKEHNAFIWFEENEVDWSTFCFLCSPHALPSSNFPCLSSNSPSSQCLDSASSCPVFFLGFPWFHSDHQFLFQWLSSITFSCRFNVFCSLFPQGLIKIFRERKTHSLAIPSRDRWCPSVAHDEVALVIVESSSNPEENSLNDNNLQEILKHIFWIQGGLRQAIIIIITSPLPSSLSSTPMILPLDEVKSLGFE